MTVIQIHWFLLQKQINFSKVARLVDEHGTAVILKNNVPRYLVIDFSKAEGDSVASNEDILSMSKRIVNKTKHMSTCQMIKLTKSRF